MKETNLADVLAWIANHSDDTEAMDKINRFTYQFTSKFGGRHENTNSPY